MRTKRNIAFLKENGYHVWSNGMGHYWVFADSFYPGYEGYMGEYVGYLSEMDLALMVRDLEEMGCGY